MAPAHQPACPIYFNFFCNFKNFYDSRHNLTVASMILKASVRKSICCTKALYFQFHKEISVSYLLCQNLHQSAGVPNILGLAILVGVHEGQLLRANKRKISNCDFTRRKICLIQASLLNRSYVVGGFVVH